MGALAGARGCAWVEEEEDAESGFLRLRLILNWVLFRIILIFCFGAFFLYRLFQWVQSVLVKNTDRLLIIRSAVVLAKVRQLNRLGNSIADLSAVKADKRDLAIYAKSIRSGYSIATIN